MILKPGELGKIRFADLAVGVDVGGTDATCATLVGISEGWRDVVLVDGYYHRQGISERMTEARYAGLVAEKIRGWSEAYPRLSGVYVDSSAKLFRTALREELFRRGVNRVAVYAFDKRDGIRQRIELGCMLQMNGRFYLAAHLGPWQEAYQMATWDEHAYEQGEWVRLDNGSYPVDALDSAEYGFYPYARYLAMTA